MVVSISPGIIHTFVGLFDSFYFCVGLFVCFVFVSAFVSLVSVFVFVLVGFICKGAFVLVCLLACAHVFLFLFLFFGPRTAVIGNDCTSRRSAFLRVNASFGSIHILQ